MENKDTNFFRLNYLCSNSPNSIQNQKNLTIEKTIQNENKIRRIKSNIISVSQNYKKINNSRNLLNKKISSNILKKNPKLIRTKSSYEKTFNDIYKSYFLEKSPNSSYLQVNNNSNKKPYNKKKYNDNNNDIDNYSQLNFTINNYIPIVDTSQYQNSKDKNNKTYFIKIDNPNNTRKKNNKELNIKQTPIKRNEKNLKTVYCINNNFSEYKLDNNKGQEIKEDNVYKNNSSILDISNNNLSINDKRDNKFDLSKFLNNKNSIKLLIKNKGKIRNYKIKKNQKLLNKNNKTESHTINLSNNSYLNYKKITETKESKNIDKGKEKIKSNKIIFHKLKKNNTDLYIPSKQKYSKITMKKNYEILNSENNKKTEIIKEKEEMIKTLLNKYQQSKQRIKNLEKNLENIKKENDSLYKYKNLYDDKEIELIQYKNNMNKYEIENNNYLILKNNYNELVNKYNKIQELKETEINNIKKEYNNLYTKYNNIKSKINELEELKVIKGKYNQLLAQNMQLNDIKNKYDKIKKENDDLKIIREKYGQILKEQKNYILIENKYNDLIEENRELKEIKNEYEKIINNKRSSEGNLLKINNISFGGDNAII